MTIGIERGSVRVSGMDADVITAAAIAAGAIGPTEIATDAIDADALAADAVTEIAAGVWSALISLGAIPQRATKTVTFTGAAGLGAVGNVPLFTVTGEVEILRIVPYVVASLTEPGGQPAPTLSLGVTNALALFIAATPILDMDTGEFWTEATAGNVANSGVLIPAALKDVAVTSDIVGTVIDNPVNGGVLRVDVYWRNLSSVSSVVAVP